MYIPNRYVAIASTVYATHPRGIYVASCNPFKQYVVKEIKHRKKVSEMSRSERLALKAFKNVMDKKKQEDGNKTGN